MADFLKWNRPEEPGLQAPSFLLDPINYVGGIGGLLSKLASRSAGKVLQHGAIVGTGKIPPLTSVSKIANLERAVKGTVEYGIPKNPYTKLKEGLDQLLKQVGQIEP